MDFTSWVSLQLSEWSENPLSTDFWLNCPLITVLIGAASLDTVVGKQSDQEDDHRSDKEGVIFIINMIGGLGDGEVEGRGGI